MFDCRIWQVPTLDLVAETFQWREDDATKNSVSMAAHAEFSHKSLQNLGSSEMKDRLKNEAGINWNDYPYFFKRGTYVKRSLVQRVLTHKELENIPERHREANSGIVTRSVVEAFDMGAPSRRVVNYKDALLFGEKPVLTMMTNTK